jgi:hypothetical protein
MMFRRDSISPARRTPDFPWLFAVILGVTVLLCLFKDVLASNEMDSLPGARQFACPSWLPADWYLNQHVGYRMVFNVLAGSLFHVTGALSVSLTGRLLSYALFAWAITGAANAARLSVVVLVPAWIWFLDHQSLVAGEWMIGALETKVFAYGFCLLSATFFFRGRYRASMITAGLAISFHVLIGVYAAICLVAAALVTFPSWRGRIRCVLAAMPWGILAASGGIVAIGSYCVSSTGVDRDLAARIYVLFRVPHHVIPFGLGWANGLPLAAGVTGGLLLLLALWRIRVYGFRFFAGYLAACLGLFSVGAIMALAGNIHMLKYYWFRYPDTLLPMALAGAIAWAASRWLEALPRMLPRKARGVFAVHTVRLMVMMIACWLVWPTGRDVLPDLEDLGEEQIPCEWRDLGKWIRENTATSDVFLVDPTFFYFYSVAERPVYVSIKHSPQSDRYLVEWLERLKRCGGATLDLHQSVFSQFPQIQRRYHSLGDQELAAFAQQDHVRYYVTHRGSKAGYRRLVESGNLAVFDLDHPTPGNGP